MCSTGLIIKESSSGYKSRSFPMKLRNLSILKRGTIHRRSKAGCFCCRKRKIKCDCCRPICDKCQRSGYMCVWPEGKQSLPHTSEFKLIKVRSKALRFVDVNCTKIRRFSSKKKVKEDDIVEKKQNLMIVVCSPGKSKVEKSREIAEDSLFRRYLQEVSEESNFIPMLTGQSADIMGVQMSHENMLLYDAFLKGFMVSVSPQLAHRKLQPGAVFIPAGYRNPILVSVFNACGAAFLCWNNKEMCRIAEVKYEHCLGMLSKFIDEESIVGNEYWLLVALLCFCLREKYHGEDVTINTCHLVAALEMIRLWQANKRRRNEFVRLPASNARNLLLYKSSMDCSEDAEPGMNDRYDFLSQNSCKPDKCVPYQSKDGTPFLKRMESKSMMIFHRLLLKMQPQFFEAANNRWKCQEMTEETELDEELENSAAEDHDRLHTGLSTVEELSSSFSGPRVVDANERTLLESFLYNYTINLFICDKDAVNYLSSPFKVFEDFREFLSPQLYNCPVPWMNNPVMGAALSAFEIAAKANWLGLQFPLSYENKVIALSLLKTAKYYARPLLPPDIKAKEPQNVQRRLLESCYMGDMVAKASYIYLKKLIYPMTSSQEPEIQQIVTDFNKDLYELTLHSQISAIGSWPIAIVGSAAIKREEQDYLIWRVHHFCDVVRSGALSTVLKYLKVVWGESKDGIRKNSPGIDALLRREYSRYLFI